MSVSNSSNSFGQKILWEGEEVNGGDDNEVIGSIDFIYIKETMMKPLLIALSGMGQGGRRRQRKLFNHVQCKVIQKCHNKSHPVQ
jgi:hypothetical protein